MAVKRPKTPCSHCGFETRGFWAAFPSGSLSTVFPSLLSPIFPSLSISLNSQVISQRTTETRSFGGLRSPLMATTGIFANLLFLPFFSLPPPLSLFLPDSSRISMSVRIRYGLVLSQRSLITSVEFYFKRVLLILHAKY